MSKASTYCIERIFLCIPHGGPSLYCFVLADSRTKTIYASVVEIVLYRFCFYGEWRRGVKKSAAHARIGVFNQVNSFFFDRLYKSHISYFSANGVERGPNVSPAPAHWCLKSMRLIFFLSFLILVSGGFGTRWGWIDRTPPRFLGDVLRYGKRRTQHAHPIGLLAGRRLSSVGRVVQFFFGSASF